jgi:hypothetical protein
MAGGLAPDMVSLFGGGVLHSEGRGSEKSNEIIPVVVSGN